MDDIIVSSRKTSSIEWPRKKLRKEYDIKDLEKVNYCLGIDIKQTKRQITIDQSGFIKDLLSRFKMADCKPAGTPVFLGTKLTADVSEDDKKDCPFRELIGGLMYLATCTRLDIAYAVSMLGQFNVTYDTAHWIAEKRVYRYKQYLKGTIDKKLPFSRDSKRKTSYADANWKGCLVDRRS